jgi:hypothetical protein
MILKPQDIFILMKLVSIGNDKWSYNTLAVAVFMSPSEVHAAIKRVLASRLAVRINDRVVPNTSNLKEFLVRGLKYVFIPDRGEMTRGMPTIHAGPPLVKHIVPSSEPPPVWPDPDGEMRGQSFSPLYKSAPKAARKDPILYELLVLLDAIRGGNARESELAVAEIKKRLDHYGATSKSEP